MVPGRRSEPRRGTPADALVVGLGNPGAQYAGTRHNVGFDAVDLLARRHGGTLRSAKREHALVAEVRMDGRRVTLAEPTTYMNESGRAVVALVRRHGIDDLAHLIVVHDELDLPVGRLRVKVGGGSAGHNGLRSIRSHLHAGEFVRVRIGVGKPPSKEQGADHVLRKVGRAERELLGGVVALAADAVETVIAAGAEEAMNRYNGTDLSAS